MSHKSLFRIACAAVMAGSAAYGLTVQTSILIKPAIPVTPFLYDGTVCMQDFASGTYRLKLVSTGTSASQELRNNLLIYLKPLAFGGTHAAWIGFTSGGSGGGGSGIGGGRDYFVRAISTSARVETNAVEGIYYIEQIAASANRVVWTDYRHFLVTDTIIELYMYDFTTSATTRITDEHGYKAAPAIRGNSIAWQDYRNKGSNPVNADIYFYDLTTRQEKPVCTQAAYQDQPDVYGTTVVWQDFRNAGSNPRNADIYLRDLSTGTERALCTAPGYQGSPRIYGSLVVWQDYRNAGSDTSNADIYAYDLTTNQEQAILTKTGYQSEPSLYGTTVVWFDFTDNTVYKALVGMSGVSTLDPAVPRGAQIAGRRMAVRGLDATSRRGGCVDIRGRRAEHKTRNPGVVILVSE